MVSQQNQELGLDLNFLWEVEENSDHYPFFIRGIPFLMLHTGLHSDYHRPGDDAEKLNLDGMRLVSRLMVSLVLEAADRDDLPAFRAVSRRESQSDRQALERPLPPLGGRLGITWDDEERSAPGVRVKQVTEGSAAARAGIRAGDRITQFAGHALAADTGFTSLVLAAESPAAVQIVREGAAGPLELSVSLYGSPVRLGIAWRTDAGEPQSVVLARVIPGSPAALAGLRSADRVYSVDGQGFASSAEFQKLVTAAPGPLRLEVERRGQLRTVVVELAPQPVSPSQPATAEEGLQ
jgi:S1-C subfamily serine protease